MASLHTILNPDTESEVWSIDRVGIVRQAGGLELPATAPQGARQGYVQLYSPDGQGLAVITPDGRTAAVSPGPAYAPAAGAGATVTGTVARTLLASGLTIPAGGLAAGQLYRLHAWGTITTTASTDQVTMETYLGGITGTPVMQLSAQSPNPGGTVAGAAWLYRTEMLLTSATAARAWCDLALNYYPSVVSQQSAAVASAAAQQLVLAVTPSAVGVSMTCAGAYCQRVL